MADDRQMNLTGMWVEVVPEQKDVPPAAPSYHILIEGDQITINWHDKVIYQTIFRLDGVELKNTKKRENWQEYVESHHYEYFDHFERIEIMDSKLVGFIFVADRGYLEIPFAKRP